MIVYDNAAYINWFPQGIAYIAAVLKRHGHEITIYNQDYHHYSDDHLTSYLNGHRFDVACVGVVGGYYQYRKLLSISAAINKSDRRPFYIIGGHGPSPEPHFFLTKTLADAVVIGEGELTVAELVQALENKTSLHLVKGIAFLENGQLVTTDERPLIKDLDTIPLPAYELFPIEFYRLLREPHAAKTDFFMPVLSGRGCPFTCNFCYRMDKGFRPRSNESIIDEILFLKHNYGINYITFADELLMTSEGRTASLCEDFIRSGLNLKWGCNGRLNYAKPRVLDLMKRAGCGFINYGIESMDDAVLATMNKNLTADQIVCGIEATFASGISPGFNVIFGNIGDNQATLDKGVKFLLKYDDCSQLRTIRPVTPYPGSPLYYYAIEQGMLKDCADFYENKHTNSDLLSVNFTEMSDDEFHRCLYEANIKLIKNYFSKHEKEITSSASKLYLEKDASFRGFRSI